MDANWTSRNTATACIACHEVDTVSTGHGQISVTGSHAVTDAAGQTCAATGAGCHPTANVAQVGAPTTTANIHLACASCHGTSSRAGLAISGALAQGCNADARCHSAGYAGTTHKAVSGDDTTHTATGMNADTDPAYTNGDLCSNCHSGTLSKAHADTSTTASLGTGRTGWAATTQSSCQDCHNATSTTGYNASANVVKGTWNDQCSACHTAQHQKYTPAEHTAAAGNGAGGGCALESGCHGYSGGAQSRDVRGLHNTAAAGCTIAGTDANGNAGACHALDKAMDATAMSCGEGGAGQICHAGYNKLNHGADHNYEPISGYTQSADTAGSETGCAGSGTGCHGESTVNKNAVIEFHPTQTMAGCGPTSIPGGANADACHGSPTMNSTWKAADKRANCFRCHDNNFTNAANAWPLYAESSTGHYGETTHTASGMGTTLGSGGSRIATCATCHSTTLRDAHGAAGDGLQLHHQGRLRHVRRVPQLQRRGQRADHRRCAHQHLRRLPHGRRPRRRSRPARCSSSGRRLGLDRLRRHGQRVPRQPRHPHHPPQRHRRLHARRRGRAAAVTPLNKDMSTAPTTCGETDSCHIGTEYTPAKHNGGAGLADGTDTDHHTAGSAQMAGHHHLQRRDRRVLGVPRLRARDRAQPPELHALRHRLDHLPAVPQRRRARHGRHRRQLV